MQYTFQATGYCGGFLALGLDTEDELSNAATVALTTVGQRVLRLTVDADEFDLASRIFKNQFHYRLTATVIDDHPTAIAFAEFVQAIQNLTELPVQAANLTAGDPAQPAPNSNPLPSLSAALTPTLLLVTIAIVALAVIVVEAK